MLVPARCIEESPLKSYFKTLYIHVYTFRYECVIASNFIGDCDDDDGNYAERSN